jgi:hypothetical protein
MLDITTRGAVGDGAFDNSTIFAAAIAALPAAGGTLFLPDGVFGISRPLELPTAVSLQLAPGATLRALPSFQGEAVVIKAAGTHGDPVSYGSIRGGTLDGGGQGITGIQVPYACRLHIGDLEVRNCTRKGINIGAEGWYEVNVSNVRCYLDHDMRHLPGSIGLHYQRCTDSLVTGVVIIGYETGLRSDSSSNDFQQIHVWNFKDNGPLRWCFYCNGWNDSYSQCYADSPIDDEHLGYGFYMTRPFQRVIGCRVYGNAWARDNGYIGVYIADGGTHGTYLGNHFTAQEGHRILKAFDGNLEAACIVGNSYAETVSGGLVCQVPSGGGGASPMPIAAIAGDRLNLAQPIDSPEGGLVGDLAWSEDARGTVLWLKTPSGWKRARLE